MAAIIVMLLPTLEGPMPGLRTVPSGMSVMKEVAHAFVPIRHQPNGFQT